LFRTRALYVWGKFATLNEFYSGYERIVRIIL